MNAIAWVFPGQGSQYVGMGKDLCEQYPQARALFQAADEALGFTLSRLCFEGPEAELTDTVNAQPAILTHSTAIVAVLRAELGTSLKAPLHAAGHSLGEYSALVSAGALGFADALNLVRARGVAMKHAGELRAGGMAAILGLDEDKVERVCTEAGVQIANYNAPGQIVISGDKAALEKAADLAKKAGAKRVMPLAVSIAAHSELMRPAVEEYRAAVEAAPLRPLTMPVISNVTAEPLNEVDSVRKEMLDQLTLPVRWVQTVERMTADGVDEFMELGPKDVLAGLIKRIATGATAISVGTPSNIKALTVQL